MLADSVTAGIAVHAVSSRALCPGPIVPYDTDMPISWNLPMDEEDRATLAQVRLAFTACCRDLKGADRNADLVAAAVAKHLSKMTSALLPPRAQAVWIDKVARPLKADPAKALLERAMASLRSWPSARLPDLVAAVTEIEAILVDTENEAHHEAIYVEISRAYS